MSKQGGDLNETQKKLDRVASHAGSFGQCLQSDSTDKASRGRNCRSRSRSRSGSCFHRGSRRRWLFGFDPAFPVAAGRRWCTAAGGKQGRSDADQSGDHDVPRQIRRKRCPGKRRGCRRRLSFQCDEDRRRILACQAWMQLPYGSRTGLLCDLPF